MINPSIQKKSNSLFNIFAKSSKIIFGILKNKSKKIINNLISKKNDKTLRADNKTLQVDNKTLTVNNKVLTPATNNNNKTNTTINIMHNNLMIAKPDILSDIHNYYRIIYSGDYLIEDIFNSYQKNWTKVFEQIYVDFPRMEMSYNGIKCKTIEELHLSILHLMNYSHSMTQSIYNLVILLCTQATFYNQFSVLHNLYKLPTFDFYILQSKDIPRINIVYHNNMVNIFFCKRFEYVNAINSHILTYFDTTMVICIKLFNQKIKYGLAYYGFVYWTCSEKILII